MRCVFLSLSLLLAAQNPPLDQQRHQKNGNQPQGATSFVTSSDIRPAVTVDGGLEPHLIPDDVAYLHFFMALSKDPSANPILEERRRTAYVQYFFKAGCGPERTEDRSLSPLQIAALFSMADDVRGSLSRIQASLPSVDLTKSRREVITTAVQALEARIGTDAAGKVRSHVAQRVKRRIKLVTPLAQTKK
jgi:hypothetical protein